MKLSSGLRKALIPYVDDIFFWKIFSTIVLLSASFSLALIWVIPSSSGEPVASWGKFAVKTPSSKWLWSAFEKAVPSSLYSSFNVMPFELSSSSLIILPKTSLTSNEIDDMPSGSELKTW